MKTGVGLGSLNLLVDDNGNKLTLEKKFEMMEIAKFDTIDFDLTCIEEIPELADENTKEFDEYFLAIKELAKKHHLEIHQTHAPLTSFYHAMTNEYFNVCVRCIKATKLLGADYIVIHPLQPPTLIYDEGADERKQLNLEFFTKLRPYLEKYDVIECIENLFRKDPERGNYAPASCSRPEEILYLIENLGSDRFQACLDIGHMLLTGDYTGDTPQGAIRKLGKHIKVLHVHDNFKKIDEHNPPFYGKGEWKEIVKALKEVGYDGVFNLEITLYRYLTCDVRVYQHALNCIRQVADFDAILGE